MHMACKLRHVLDFLTLIRSSVEDRDSEESVRRPSVR